jgi:hypothetical protein
MVFRLKLQTVPARSSALIFTRFSAAYRASAGGPTRFGAVSQPSSHAEWLPLSGLRIRATSLTGISQVHLRLVAMYRIVVSR